MIDVLFSLGRWIVARIDIRNERAATAVEYALMVSLIAVVVIVAVVVVGQKSSSTFDCTGQSLVKQADQCK